MYENQVYAYGGTKNMLTAVDNEKQMAWTSRYLQSQIKELNEKLIKLDEKRDSLKEELMELSSCMSEVNHFEQLAFPLEAA